MYFFKSYPYKVCRLHVRGIFAMAAKENTNRVGHLQQTEST